MRVRIHTCIQTPAPAPTPKGPEERSEERRATGGWQTVEGRGECALDCGSWRVLAVGGWRRGGVLVCVEGWVMQRT